MAIIGYMGSWGKNVNGTLSSVGCASSPCGRARVWWLPLLGVGVGWVGIGWCACGSSTAERIGVLDCALDREHDVPRDGARDATRARVEMTCHVKTSISNAASQWINRISFIYFVIFTANNGHMASDERYTWKCENIVKESVLHTECDL